MMQKTVTLALLVVMACLMTGCNTVRGMGKDIHDSAMNVQSWMEGSQANNSRIPPPR